MRTSESISGDEGDRCQQEEQQRILGELCHTWMILERPLIDFEDDSVASQNAAKFRIPVEFLVRIRLNPKVEETNQRDEQNKCDVGVKERVYLDEPLSE